MFTASDLRRCSLATGSPYFSKETMKFFGDTMGNYGVRSKPVMIDTGTDKVECWVLYRKNPVNGGLSNDAYFDVKDFNVVTGNVSE